MPSISNKQKRHLRSTAKRWADKKVKMESPFKRELRSYFSQQAKRVRSGLEIESIAPVLEKHYRRVSRDVAGVRLKQDEEYGLEEAIIGLLFGREYSQAVRIDGTTRKILRRSVEIARQELADLGTTFPTATEINRVTSNIFKNLNNSRVGGIAVFETQQLTEKIRTAMTDVARDMIEDAIVAADKELAKEAARISDSMTFEQIADDIGSVPPPELFAAARSFNKAWVTVGDSKVRPAHQAANFQIVPYDEPFVVMGELLNEPGDNSLGASLENTSGCRCSSVNM